MSSLPADTRLDAMVSMAVANYGQYTGDVVGLGHGRVDRVLEVPVVPMADWEHAYTRTPMIHAYKLASGGTAKVRSFVYVIPLEVRDGREQRMRVGCDGEDLDIATFFRPVGLDARTGDKNMYVAMPTKAFAREGDAVQYAFRVRNYVEMRDGTLFALDTLQIGMELATSAQKKHARRGVMLITNERMFSSQLGEEGDKQAGFMLQWAGEGSMTDAAPADSKAVLHTQAFGFVARPPSTEERLTRFLRSHFHLCPRVQTKGMGATRGGGGATRGGGSSLSFGKALAGEARHVNVRLSEAEPIAERTTVEMCLVVGDVARVFHEKHVEARVSFCVAPDAMKTDESSASPVIERRSGFSETMRCLSRMMIESKDGSAQKAELMQAIDDLRAWPTLRVDGPLGSLAPSNFTAIAVGVVECEDRDDEEGMGLSKTSGGIAERVYTVRVGTLISVRLTNFSLGGERVKVKPVYFNVIEDSHATLHVDEEAEFVLEPGDTYELPYPIQMEPGENENGWMLKDGDGKTVLKISFVLDAEDNARFKARLELEAREREHEEREKVKREAERAEREKVQAERDVMLVEADGTRPVLECVVCMEKKTISELPALVPCGHAVCCFQCFQKKIEVDTAKGLRSTCPLCRAVVQTAMRVYF